MYENKLIPSDPNDANYRNSAFGKLYQFLQSFSKHDVNLKIITIKNPLM